MPDSMGDKSITLLIHLGRRLLLAFIVGVGLLSLSGCGVGALLTALGIGISEAVDDSSSGTPGFARASFSVEPARETLRGRGDASLVPICYTLTGAATVDSLVVEYAREDESFAAWYPATVLSEVHSDAHSEVTPCADGTYWWDAESDLRLASAASPQRVRIRVSLGGQAGEPDISAPFFVGNESPDVEFLQISDDQGDITVSFSARDPEGDPLRDVQLFFQIPGEPEYEIGGCDIASRSPPESGPEPECTPAPHTACVDPPLTPPLPAPPERAIYSVEWDSLEAVGCRNVNAVTLRLVVRDDFGMVVEAVAERDLRNNRPPEAFLVGSPQDLDKSFEVPIPFRLVDADGHDVDVVVQFARTGEDFPILGAEFDDAACRRQILTAPEFATLRRAHQIATPASRGMTAARRPESAGSDVIQVAASPAGMNHTFLWDTAEDLTASATQSLRLRLTPFDEVRGRAALSETHLRVDNEPYPLAQSVLHSVGRIGGVAVDDIDGDGRSDLALALPEAPAEPGEETGATGRIDIFLRSVDGSLAAAASYSLRPGATETPQPGEIQLLDVNGDARTDLLVLNSNCRGGTSCNGRGDVSVFLGTGRIGESRLPARPHAVLPAESAPGSLLTGRFTNRHGASDAATGTGIDIVVSHPSSSTIGLFQNRGQGQFSHMVAHPMGGTLGPITRADFTGDLRDELAAVVFRATGRAHVDVLRWESDGWVLWSRFDVGGPVALAAGQFDGLGLPDLAVAEGNVVSFFANATRNVDDPVFFRLDSLAVRLTEPPASLNAYHLLGDAAPEIVAWERLGGILRILHREPLLEDLPDKSPHSTCDTLRPAPPHYEWHSFTAIQPELPAGGVDIPESFGVGDVDDDGAVDLIAASELAWHVFRAERAGSLATRTDRLTVPIAGLLQDFTLADVNHDGRRDIAASLSGTDAYHVLLYYQDSLGGFAPAPHRVLTAQPSKSGVQATVFLAAADVDADGATDWLAMARQGGVDLFHYENGEFSETPTAVYEQVALPAGPIELGEFDGVPGVDLLRLDAIDGIVLLTMLPPEDGANGAVRVVEVATEPLESRPISVAPADFDGDGRTDLAILRVGGVVDILQQTSEGLSPRFRRRASLPVPSGVGQVRAVRLDADNAPDVLVAAMGEPAVLGFRQERTSMVGVGTLARLQSGARDSARATDVLDARHLKVEWRFTQTVAIPLPATPVAAVVGDLSGDDRSDLALRVRDADAVQLFFQTASEKFSPRPSRSVELEPGWAGQSPMAIGDVSGDTRSDLVILRPSAGEILIWRSR